MRNKKRPWTEQDDQKLARLAQAGRSSLSMAAAMGRSRSAVVGRLSKLRQPRPNATQNVPERSGART